MSPASFIDMSEMALLMQKGISIAAAALALAIICHPISGRAVDAAELDEGAAREFVRKRPLCERPSSGPTIKFSGLYPAIEGKIPLSNFAAGQVVEIDPKTMPEEEARAYIAAIKSLGGRVSIYLIGGHCELGPDCDGLRERVTLGSTGSWNWNMTERRILDITHPLVLARLAAGIENGWRLGANYIRIDNLHHPAGSKHPRTT